MKRWTTWGLACFVGVVGLAAGCATGTRVESASSPEPMAHDGEPVEGSGTLQRREFPDHVWVAPRKSELPAFAPTEVLETEAAAVPVEERRFFGIDENGIMGFTAPLHRRGDNVFPVFHFDGSLRGIYVSGVGIISRAEYEDPSFDPERAAMDRMGEDEYWASMERLYCAGVFLERTGQPPEKAEDVIC